MGAYAPLYPMDSCPSVLSKNVDSYTDSGLLICYAIEICMLDGLIMQFL